MATVDKIQKVGDVAHKKANDIVNEFLDWQDISEKQKEFRSFLKKNSTFLKKNVKELEPIRKSIDELNKQFETFQDYQTLKRLIDRNAEGIVVSRKAGTKPLKKYQRLIDQGLIKDITGKKKFKGKEVEVQNYELSKSKPDAVEYFNKLKEDLIKTEFHKNGIEDKISQIKESYAAIRENVKELKDTKQEFVDEGAKAIQDHLKNKKYLVENARGDIGVAKKLWDKIKSVEYFTGMNFRFISKILDGGKFGPFSKYLYQPLRDGIKASEAHSDKMGDLLASKLKKAGITPEILSTYSKDFNYGITSLIENKMKVKHIPAKIGDSNLELTKSQRVMLYMYSKNEHARDAVLNAGVVFKQDSPKAYKFKDEKQYNDFLKTLTDEEKKIADILFEYFDLQGQEINKVSEKDIGVALADEKMYLPMIRQSSKIESKMDVEEIKSLSQVRDFLKQGKPGTLKERKTSNAPLVLMGAFEVLSKTSPMIENYIGTALPSKQVEAILNNIKADMDSKGLSTEYNTLKRQLEVFNNPSLYKYGANKFVYAIDKLLVPAVLGLKLPIVALQLTDAPLYFTQVPLKEMLNLPEVLSKAPGFNKLVKKYSEKSSMINNIFKGALQSDLFESGYAAKLREKTGSKHGGFRKAMSSEGFMTPMMWANNFKIGAYIALAEAQIKKENPGLDTNSEEFTNKVIAKVEPIIEATQPLFDALDKPEINHVPVFRTQSYFTSQTVKMGQMVIDGVLKIKNGKTRAEQAEGLRDIIMVLITQGSLYTAMVGAVSILTGRKDDEEVYDLVQFLKDSIANMAQFQGAIGGFISSWFSGYKYRMLPPIAEDALEVSKIGTNITQSIFNGEDIDWDVIGKSMEKIGSSTIPGYGGIKQLHDVYTNFEQ